jgi:hypothetical protein
VQAEPVTVRRQSDPCHFDRAPNGSGQAQGSGPTPPGVRLVTGGSPAGLGDIGFITISLVRARCGLLGRTPRVCGVAWVRSDKSSGPTAGSEPVPEDRTTTISSIRSVRASDSPLLHRPTSSPSGPGLTIPGESDDDWSGSGNRRVHPGAVQEADPHLRVRAVESE